MYQIGSTFPLFKKLVVPSGKVAICQDSFLEIKNFTSSVTDKVVLLDKPHSSYAIINVATSRNPNLLCAFPLIAPKPFLYTGNGSKIDPNVEVGIG